MTLESRFKNTITRMVNEYSEVLNISHWVFLKTMEKEDERVRDGEFKTMECEVNPRYQRLYLYIYPIVFRTWKRRGNEYLSEIVMHELSHALTQHLYDLNRVPFKAEEQVREEWERLTEAIAQVALKARKGVGK